MKIRITLFVVAALLIGAHFLRARDLLLVGFCVAAPLLFLYRNRWSLIVLQLCAYGATAAWLHTAYRLVEFRQHIGRSWTVAAIILGSVALFTLISGLLLNSRCMRERYPVK